MIKQFSFSQLISTFRSTIAKFPEKRIGKNSRYSMIDVGLGAFSIFFTQSPSFLSFQTSMKESKGKSNAETLFGMGEIPSDNQIRDILDSVSPDHVFPVFEHVFKGLEATKRLEDFRSYDNKLLVLMDGVQYFTSQKIHCENCSKKKHRDGKITYSHSMLTPVIAAPNNNKVIPLAPEFITPQDGHHKQDCENAAAKRWISKHAKTYRDKGIIILGDDLYCKQPICELLLEEKSSFILVCKPDSHKILYRHLENLELGKDIHQLTRRWKNGKKFEIYTYRYANQVPLRDGEDALPVNWCELTVTTEEGKIIYKNAFVTNYKISHKNVEGIVAAGRTRWKIENENNNTLKTKGYHLEHNFGHGKKHLSSLLATLNILAFLFHTLLEMMDEKYRLIRKTLPTRKTFFNDIRALTRYMCFDNWNHLLDFMLQGLELEIPPNSS